MGVKYDLMLALRSQIFEYLHETFYRALEYLEPARSENKTINDKKLLPKRLSVIDDGILKVRGWPGHIFAASARPMASR